jgi:hypothetical protein
VLTATAAASAPPPTVVAGRIIHLPWCEWCWFHKSIFDDKGRNEQEFCVYDARPIPEPMKGRRWCERFSQYNCTCEKCLTTRIGNDKIRS